MIRYTHYIIISCLYITLSLCAQDDTLSLSEVRMHFPKSLISYSTDSLFSKQNTTNNFDQSLALCMPITFKNYGSGNVTTSSYRGGTSTQTVFLWNGLNINNLNSGNTDFSSINNNTFQKITLQSTNENYQNGFGYIDISTKKPQLNGNQINITNSLNTNHVQDVSINSQKKTNRLFIYANYFQKKGLNDYTYDSLNELKKQKHSKIHLRNFTSGLSYNFKKSHTLSIHTWFNSNSREVPPTLGIISNANQADQFTRIISEYQYLKTKFSLNFYLVYLKDYLRYTDSIKKIDSEIASETYKNIIRLQYEILKNLFIKFNSELESQKAISNNYAEKFTRNILSNRINLEYNFRNHYNLFLWSSNQTINSSKIPLTYGITSKIKINSNLFLEFTNSKYIRIPTFNDLYWKELGNKNLRPEKGYSNELNLLYTVKINKKLSFKLTNSFFTKKINEFIIWLPNEQNIWTPQNARKIWSRGLETSWNLSYNCKKIKIKYQGYYTFTRSTNSKVDSNTPTSILNKQLIYIPIHTFSNGVNVICKQLYFSLYAQYTSWRFTSTDNKNFLPMYTTFQFGTGYTMKLNNSNSVTYEILIDNLFNKRYESVLNYPSSLRTIKFQLSYNLNSITNAK